MRKLGCKSNFFFGLHDDWYNLGNEYLNRKETVERNYFIEDKVAQSYKVIIGEKVVYGYRDL